MFKCLELFTRETTIKDKGALRLCLVLEFILLYFKMISLNAYKIPLWETILATDQNSLHHDLSFITMSAI
jgi:hypothetical protein